MYSMYELYMFDETFEPQTNPKVLETRYLINAN